MAGARIQAPVMLHGLVAVPKFGWPLIEVGVCLMVQIPTVGFLYIAGWIGTAGRDYLIASKGEAKPREKEYIIDVPLALKISAQGAGWPFRVIRELQKGTLLEKDSNITVSPR